MIACWPRCAAVFSAGFVWSVIDQKWPGFEEAFLGFNPKRLLFQPAEFWHDLASDSASCAIRRKSSRCAEKREVRERYRSRTTAASASSSPHGRSTIRSA